MSSDFLTRIGLIADIYDGPHATPKKTDTGPYFLSISSLRNGALDLDQSAHLNEEDFKKWTKRVTPEEGDILFSYETRLGEAALMPSRIRACLGRRMGLLRPDHLKVTSAYLLYAYLSPEFQKIIEQRKILGATVDRIALKELPDFPVRIPSIQEQKQVTGVLNALDSKIQLNNQINQTLEQMAQALFKSWFVDFEPVKAKIAALEAGGSEEDALLAAMQVIAGDAQKCANAAESSAPGVATGDKLARLRAEQPEQYATLCATAELFPSAMQDSELGEIPEGWEIGALSELIQFNPRRTLKKGTLAPYLDMKNVPTSGHLAEEVVNREMNSGTKFINGDTLLARITPCLENGKTAYVDFLTDNQVGWGSTEYIVMRPQDGYPEAIGYLIARNTDFRQHAIQSMTGTSGRQRANAKALAELPWIIYPHALAEAFNSLASPYLRLARSHGNESKLLSCMRESLLPKLLSGELKMTKVDT